MQPNCDQLFKECRYDVLYCRCIYLDILTVSLVKAFETSLHQFTCHVSLIVCEVEEPKVDPYIFSQTKTLHHLTVQLLSSLVLKIKFSVHCISDIGAWNKGYNLFCDSRYKVEKSVKLYHTIHRIYIKY